MQKNEGPIDRVARVAIGLGILTLAFIGPQTPWAYIGIVPILTGLVGYCPLYTVLGLNTCPVKPENK